MVTPSDPKAPHRGELPERPRIDAALLGMVVAVLEHAHYYAVRDQQEDALRDMREALETLGREVVRVTHTGSPGVGVTRVADPLVAARERLGCWLAAETDRSWWHHVHSGGTHSVLLTTTDREREDGTGATGIGPDLASAILAALDAANGGGRG